MKAVKFDRANRIDEKHRTAMGLWAAKCAERVLPLFEKKRPGDKRPRAAIEEVRAWVRGEIRVGAARKAALGAHAAARAVTDVAAREAARAAGHAAGTAHVAEHARGASWYGLKAIRAAGGDVEAEWRWQKSALPARLRRIVWPPADGQRNQRRRSTAKSARLR